MDAEHLEHPQSEAVEQGAKAILEGRLQELGWDFAEEISPLYDGWCDRHPSLGFLENLYHSTATQTGTNILRVEDIVPEKLLPVLSDIMVLDVLEEGRNGRYRVYGSNIARYAGTDWTGATLQGILRESGGQTPIFLASIYRAVYLTRRPYISIHRPASVLTIERWCRLILPVVDGSDQIVRFLVGDVAEGGFEPTGEEWVSINKTIRPHHLRKKR